MFFFFPCAKCRFTLMAQNSAEEKTMSCLRREQGSAEEKTIFTATCKNCGTFYFFYFEKMTREIKKKQLKILFKRGLK